MTARVSTPRLAAKLALHRELRAAQIHAGLLTPDDFDAALAEGYQEIDRLFDEDEAPRPPVCSCVPLTTPPLEHGIGCPVRQQFIDEMLELRRQP